jgi:hypothetical protein
MNMNAIERVQGVARRLLETIKANPVVSGLATAVLGTAWYVFGRRHIEIRNFMTNYIRVIHDYRQWRAFGTGGTPPNV